MSAWKQAIVSDSAPRGRGPYPQALKVGPFIYVSGQGPLDPATNAPIAGSFEDQVRLTFANVKAILAAADLGLEHIVRITVYVTDIARVPEFNRLYEALMPKPWPARTLLEVGLRGIDVEFDVIAADPKHPAIGSL